jgi:ribosomal protein S18 acetylase RimI-like enzyme
MCIKFYKVSDFDRGTLFNLLKDAYTYDPRFEEHFLSNWRECDDFFYDNINIADSCCIVTSLCEKAIGFVCWDPRNMPEYVEIGHNCIAQEFKGFKYGKLQLEEAISRIQKGNVKKIIVTTNESLYAAQKNYESVGFIEVLRRDNDSDTRFSGAYIDYEIICEKL